jgi:hypothetical protein
MPCFAAGWWPRDTAHDDLIGGVLFQAFCSGRFVLVALFQSP